VGPARSTADRDERGRRITMRGPESASSDVARIVRVPVVGGSLNPHGVNNGSKPMAAQSAAVSDQTTFSRWVRDYLLSLVLIVVGAVVLLVSIALTLWANSTGNYPTSYWTGLAIHVTETGGAMLILLAGTVAYYHWRGLQVIEGTA
jgi:hypothetical protein